MMGFDLVVCPGSIDSAESSVGETPSEGPLDVDVLARLITGVDFEARLAKVAARSSWFNSAVKTERRETN